MRVPRPVAASGTLAWALLLLAPHPAAALPEAVAPPAAPAAVTCAATCSWSAPGFVPPSLAGAYLPLDGGCPDLQAAAPAAPGDYQVTLTICCVADPLDCSERTRTVRVSPVPLLSDGFESGGLALWLVGGGA